MGTKKFCDRCKEIIPDTEIVSEYIVHELISGGCHSITEIDGSFELCCNCKTLFHGLVRDWFRREAPNA